MLVKFIDKSEQPVWINPLHVRVIQPKNKGALIMLGTYHYVKVTATAEEAAEAISAALPDQVVLMPDDDEEEVAATNS